MSYPFRMFALLLILSAAGEARSEPPAPPEERATILRVEMHRRGAKELSAFLVADAHPLSRLYALRALGRIGEDDPAAVRMLDAYLRTGHKAAGDLDMALWCAGIAKSKALAEAIGLHLSSKAPSAVAAAAEALGWTEAEGVSEKLKPLLRAKDAAVVRGALMGLARTRKDSALKDVLPLLADKHAPVRHAAEFAVWRLASAHRQAEKKKDEKWNGDAALSAALMPHLKDADAKRTMAVLRPLGILLPTKLSASAHAPVLRLADHEDPRVVQDLVSRVLSAREGEDVEMSLAALLAHADAKVRRLATDALAARREKPTKKAAADALAVQFKRETDARMKERLAIALATLGNRNAWGAWSTSKARAVLGADDGPELGPGTIKALLANADGGLSKALAWLDANENAHGIVWSTTTEELKEAKGNEALHEWLATQTEPGEAWIATDRYKAGAWTSLACSVRAWHAIEHVVESTMKALSAGESLDAHDLARTSLAGAVAELVRDKTCPEALKGKLTNWVKAAAISRESAWIRRAARTSLKALEMPLPATADSETLPVNEWKGLPRPKSPVFGVDLTKGNGPWLSETEILQLADAIAFGKACVRLETTQGSFDVSLDAEAAPVHAVNFVLAVHAGLYNGTRWHRVVPNFVIQGGDPLGHGAGDGGWSIPDEISPLPYVRGALGMPKSQKDDGGCQVFFMHTEYTPLNERYSCYGGVTRGLDVVDKIRVGDRIVRAQLISE